ncbi:hypothetical protein [Muribaculum intestinale]|jgi:hypothetical protein|nr:hypothetical protein [Muribaculum intestinale]
MTISITGAFDAIVSESFITAVFVNNATDKAAKLQASSKLIATTVSL